MVCWVSCDARAAQVGLPLSHEVYAGENICWTYLTTKCSDIKSASDALAEHGRTAHRLHEQWKLECKRANAAGQKLPTAPKKVRGR